MTRTDAIIIGAGQAGLAMSRCLTARGIAHVVIERGRIGERWRSQRWDSLKLLTPNWMTRLPGAGYEGPDPDGFMAMDEVVGFLEQYSRSFAAPILGETEVFSLARTGGRYIAETTRGSFEAPCAVIATGHCGRPSVPAYAGALSRAIDQVVPARYRNPGHLAGGGVLVVGASASGLQIAEEVHRSGRPVTLAVGHHTRLPRTYRGRDIMYWLERTGTLAERWDQVPDLDAARAQPSLQLAGRDDHSSLDLGTLAAAGVRVVGRASDGQGTRIHFSGDLARRVARADAKLVRLTARIDAHIAACGETALPEGTPVAPLGLDCPPLTLDLRAEDISTVVWATGYGRDYGWLDVPVLDGAGEIMHQGGICPAAGLYVLGLQFLRRRSSSFIGGVGADAEDLAAHLARRLGASSRLAA